MKTDILTIATALSDGELLTRIETLARTERESTAELVGHLAVLEIRPSAYAALGYGSLFNYCVDGLHLSEDAASTRIAVARLGRRFPALLQMLSSGALSLTAARTLGPHLTPQNHEAVLARAAHQRLEGIEALVAEISPRADVKATIRKLPGPMVAPDPEPATEGNLFVEVPSVPAGDTDAGLKTAPPSPTVEMSVGVDAPAGVERPIGVESPGEVRRRRAERPRMQPLSPERYRVQFTIGQETHDAVKRLQALMRRELPSGDIAAIFEHGVQLLLEKVEKAKLGGRRGKTRVFKASAFKKTPPGEQARRDTVLRSMEPSVLQSKEPSHPTREDVGLPDSDSIIRVDDSTGPTYENRIRFETDRQPPRRSRHIPSAVKRAVWWRDGAQCAFVSAAGVRCTERSYLELHHIHPYALDGPTTARNISLRCRRHNAYEAEVVFGTRVTRRG